jgi:hypothetical protein
MYRGGAECIMGTGIALHTSKDLARKESPVPMTKETLAENVASISGYCLPS